MRSLFVFALAASLAVFVGCEPAPPVPPPISAVTCIVNGATFDEGAVFPAEDGCNECLCTSDGTVSCTDVACGGEGEGEAGEGEGEGEPGGGITPLPDDDCIVIKSGDAQGRSFTVDSSSLLPPGTDATSLFWSIARAPAASRPVLDSRSSPTFTLHSTMFGVYVVELTYVASGAGLRRSCTVRDFPSDAVVVELVWDMPVNDIDLHVTKADTDGQLCVDATSNGTNIAPESPLQDCNNELDCNYAGCKANNASGPDWDGVAGRSAGDPLLAIDDLSGFGPEIIVAPQATDGVYGVGVNFYSGSVPTTTTTRLWIAGQLLASSTDVLDGQDLATPFGFTVEGAQVCVDSFDDSEPRCFAMPSCTPVQTCAQCVDDDGCGPGTRCDTQASLCVSADPACTADEDCRCPEALDVCSASACVQDSDCEGQACIVEVGVCADVLGAPVCEDFEDLDEPNDTLASATEFDDAFAGYLCRNDRDVFAFAVDDGRRYTVTIDFGGSGQPGIAASLLNEDGLVLDAATFGASDASVAVASNADGDGTLYVQLDGTSATNDSWTYDISVVEGDPAPPADCDADDDDDTFESATPFVVGTAIAASFCGAGDVDFFRVQVPPLNGIEVTLANFFNTDVNLDLELFQQPNELAGSRIDVSATTADIEIVDGGEAREFWVKVSSTDAVAQDQLYTLRANALPRPAECSPDPTEDDGSFDDAAPLVLSAGALPSVVLADVIRCNPDDNDFFRFTMPPLLGGSALLRFAHSEGDMKLELFRADDLSLVASSNTSNVNTDPDEQVTVPGGTTPIDYILVASLVGTTGIIGQLYTLEVITFDDSQCLATEPSGGDDAFRLGRCIGNFTPLRTEDPCTNDAARIAEPMLSATMAICEGAPDGSVNGCGRMCGNNDSDWYRVGILNNDQILHAILDYDPSEGELALARGTMTTATGAVVETSSTDSDHDGHLELSFAAPRNQPKEYGIRVKPIGTTGHQVQQYALQIELGAECPEDANDIGALVNEIPNDATVIRPGFDEATPLDFVSTKLSRCTNDIDVYEVTVFAGETITVELDQADTSPNGLIAEIGTRPANLNNPAVLIDTVVAGAAPLTFVTPTGQDLYVTVKAPAGTIVTGPYTLRVTASQ